MKKNTIKLLINIIMSLAVYAGCGARLLPAKNAFTHEAGPGATTIKENLETNPNGISDVNQDSTLQNANQDTAGVSVQDASRDASSASEQEAEYDSDTPPRIRLSEELYIAAAATDKWQPYFTGNEPEWIYNPEQPWAPLKDIGNISGDQSHAYNAFAALESFKEEFPAYAGAYVNADGYLTVMLVNPTMELAAELAERLPEPVWIIAAEYSYHVLNKAFAESYDTVMDWIDRNPSAKVWCLSGCADEVAGRVVIDLHGSGVLNLLNELDFPPYVEFNYTPIDDPSAPANIPGSPNGVWEKGGVTIKSARESYPIGADYILLTAGHNVAGMRLYASYMPLSVEKYTDGGWANISGNFISADLYREMFDIPAGEEKIVPLRLIAPETLGPGLYRAIYYDRIVLSASNDHVFSSDEIIAGGSESDKNDRVTIEFIITDDAEPLPPLEDILAR